MEEQRPEDVTELLARVGGSGRGAVNLLFEKLYEELRAIAERRLRAERPGHTLSPTALISEAYVKLASLDRLTWKNRSHFFAIAARAMRQILVNHAREHRAAKRGGDLRIVTLQDGMEGEPASTGLSWDDVITVDRALAELERLSERQARVMELRLFAGFTHEEIAGVLDVSVPTVRREWRLGRAFLARALS